MDSICSLITSWYNEPKGTDQEKAEIAKSSAKKVIPYLPQPLNPNDYGDVQTLNELCEFTHDLSSDYQNAAHHALLTLFNNTSGEIKRLWETDRRLNRAMSEKPGDYGALCNRVKRYDATKQNTVLKFHLDLVKSTAESLFLLKENNIIDAATNMGIKQNVGLFRQHMENLPNAKSQMQYDLQINTFFEDYQKWFAAIKPKTLKAGILVKADPDSIYNDWEMGMGQDPENFRN